MPSEFSKTHHPKIQRVYLRERLFSMLDEATQRAMTWISANAGAGKTVLLVSYLESRQIPDLWYQMDARDADAATFFYYLRKAACQIGLPQAEALPLLTPDFTGAEKVFAQNFFAQLFSEVRRPFALVFDNFQDLPEDCRLHALLSEALKEISPAVRIFVMSRTAPPAAMARWRANRQMAFIDAEVMRLDKVETAGILELQSDASINSEIIDAIYKDTGGWAAGVILLYEHNKQSGAKKWQLQNTSQETMFRYFASELYEHTPENMRQFLLRTAIVPHFDIEIACNLTGMDDAELLVRELLHRNYFIYQEHSSAQIYYYHPLFRDFLLASARRQWQPAELQQAGAQAAEILQQKGWIEEAIEVLFRAGGSEALEALILQHAQTLFAQGRYRILQHWIEDLGEATVTGKPWLSYWLGNSRLPVDLLSARDLFERAFTGFRSNENIIGALLAWYGVVQTYHYFWGEFAALDNWIEAFDELLPLIPAGLPVQIEWQMAAGMFVSLMYRQPSHPDIGLWRGCVERLVMRGAESNQDLDLGSKLLTYYLWVGDLGAADQLVPVLSRLAKQSAPMTVIFWLSAKASYHFFRADFDASITDVSQALEIAQRQGIHGLDFFSLGQGVYAMLCQSKLKEADEYLQRMHALMPPASALHDSHYHFLMAWQACLARDIEMAAHHIQITLDTVERGGTPFPHALALIAQAHISLAQGDTGAAMRNVDLVRSFAAGMHSNILAMKCELLTAEVDLVRGDEMRAVDELRMAFARAAKQRYLNFDWWLPESLACLCALAVRHNIEPDFTRALIQKRKLVPNDSAVELESWPWAVRIYTLGRFSLVLQDKPVTFNGKVQKRPLELLKALISFGGHEVKEQQLMSSLWPDSDNEMAKQNLKSAVYRLRKLLETDVLQWREGKLSLDFQYCWVDALVVERMVSNLSRALPEDMAQLAQATQQVSALYQGGFLQGEDRAYVLGTRERLRSKVLRLLIHVAERFAAQGEYEQALHTYQSGLEIEPLDEVFYRGIMLCQQSQNRIADALTTFEHYKAVLHNSLDLEPSQELKEFAASLRGQDT